MTTERIIFTFAGPEIVPATMQCVTRGCTTRHDPLRERAYTPYCEPCRKEHRAIDMAEAQ